MGVATGPVLPPGEAIAFSNLQDIKSNLLLPSNQTDKGSGKCGACRRKPMEALIEGWFSGPIGERPQKIWRDVMFYFDVS